MNKIKISQNQADAIEEECHRDYESILYDYLAVAYYDEKFKGLTFGGLYRALHHGYVVEPEFICDVGDWIKDTSTGAVIQIRNKQQRNNIMDKRYTTKRHATPSEIAEEKERGFWKEHGRDVWSVEDGDIVRKKSDGFCFDVAVYSPEHIKKNSELYEIACFWEDRLDVKANDI